MRDDFERIVVRASQWASAAGCCGRGIGQQLSRGCGLMAGGWGAVDASLL